MNMEEQIKIIKNMLLHAETQLLDYEAIAIETLLTAYEEKCKELKKEIQDDLDVRNRWGLTLQELEKEKEKKEELIKERAKEIVYVDKNFIRKDKIKPIQIIDLDGKIHNVYKIEEE